MAFKHGSEEAHTYMINHSFRVTRGRRPVLMTGRLYLWTATKEERKKEDGSDVNNKSD